MNGKKVGQMQTPGFALNTRMAWALRFDDVLTDALELTSQSSIFSI